MFLYYVHTDPCQCITVHPDFNCDFEFPCPELSRVQGIDWKDYLELLLGRDISEKDNTLNSQSGHMMYLSPSSNRPGYRAALQTPFLNVDVQEEICFAFFYRILGSSLNLSVSLVWEDRSYELLHNVTDFFKLSDLDYPWQRLEVMLPPGRYQVQLTIGRGTNGTSGILVDDISLKPCQSLS